MSDHHSQGNAPSTPSYARPTSAVHGTLAEFDDVTKLTRACESVRDEGFANWDAHTPFPVHGLDAAMGVKPTKLPWVVLCAGLFGLTAGMVMQCWMNGIDYKFIISGKPLFSIPAFVPVCFELTVLCAALTTFFGCLAFNKLPELFHPLNLSQRFRRATDDRFFVYVEAKDPKYDAGKVENLLAARGATHVEIVRYETDGLHTRLPQGTLGIALIVGVAALAPIVMFARARDRTSDKPRLHLAPPAPIKDDMDSQYKFKAQTTNWFFHDQRAARNWPQGTVAQEDAVTESAYLTGRTTVAAVPPSAPPSSQHRAAHTSQQASKGAQLVHPEIPQSAPQAPFAASIPRQVVLSDKTLARGRERFNVYCSTCHGISGHGDGMVARHADALQEGTWVSPTNLHEPRVRELLVGDIYNTITHGVRNMPAYGHLIEPEDRWLIVAYVKSLQRSLWAKSTDVPDDVRPTVQ